MATSDLDRVEIYRRRGRGWRWRYVAAGNNKRLAHSGEAYQGYPDCLETARRVLHLRPTTLWTEVPSRNGTLQTFIATRYNGEQITVELSHR